MQFLYHRTLLHFPLFSLPSFRILFWTFSPEMQKMNRIRFFKKILDNFRHKVYIANYPKSYNPIFDIQGGESDAGHKTEKKRNPYAQSFSGGNTGTGQSVFRFSEILRPVRTGILVSAPDLRRRNIPEPDQRTALSEQTDTELRFQAADQKRADHSDIL